MFHHGARQEPLFSPTPQVAGPQFTADEAAIFIGALQIIQPIHVGRERRQICITFGCDLPFTVLVVNPKNTLAFADGSDKRLSIRRERHSVFFACAKGNLLRWPFRKALPPDMKTISGVRGKIHPFSIRRPACKGTLSASGSDALSGRTTVK